MAERKHKENDVSLPFAALQLLAPPVRLVSAALWKVMKQRDVMQYGVLEEVVTSTCETVPGLLTVRHQGKLALGLRGRLILELCSAKPDEKVIAPHLQRMRAPAAMSLSSATVKRDVKIIRTVESFHSLVHTLLKDPTVREHFFKEEFPVDYGPKFDQELEKLLWEFLIRLDQLLPVPNLAQTVMWLSDAPPVLEECAQAATQPQLLKILLEHQTCLGHLEAAASLPPNMGDSILTSLSLPPSGRIPSNGPTGAKRSGADQSGGTRDKTAFITPVIGLMSNEDVPFMIRTKDATNEHLHRKENLKYTVVKERQNPKDGQVRVKGERNESKRSSGMKRKQPDEGEEQCDDEEEEVLDMTGSWKKGMSRSLSRASTVAQKRGEGGGGAVKKEECNRAALKTCMTRLGVKALPEDPSARSLFISCLMNQPRVVLERMTSADGGGAKSPCVKREARRRKSPVKAPTQSQSRPQKPDPDVPGLDDKESYKEELYLRFNCI
ncbi:TERF1-interacting nuclear factor 2 isoform X2 [Pseudoliparis swirei]|uniref:TERF1-interacting nuclear factor 2 isoform X2 n=1 Tax=Pseudoliparis swirei TaxID=2059687 RepID=UPI0024BD95F9|nr:TERF1-interacting nuclear factor 2 isoform X2 [Pseudoliparis swirei]